MVPDLYRRSILKALCSAPALAIPAFAFAEQSDGWLSQFEAAQRNLDWSLGYVTPPDRLQSTDVAVRGRFPAAVQGVLYRNGPALHDFGGVRYHHWFDGDGMLQKFTIRTDSVDHLGKFIRTEKFIAEQQAGRRLVEAFGTKLPDVIKVTSGDSLNVANTSVLPFHGQLLALWEGGSATKVNADTLEAEGLQTWRADLAALPFSAHPRVDVDGTIWNFGVGSGQGLLILYQIGANGEMKKSEAIPIEDVPMIHDFAITQTKLVFLMPPLAMELARFAGNDFLDSHVWRGDMPMRVLVVDKNDFSQRRILELPAAFLFHVGNAWEDASGVIRLDYIHSDQPDSLFGTFREVMRGRYLESAKPRLATVTIDPRRGIASREVLPIDGEFPRIDSRLTGRRHQRVIHATGSAMGKPGFTAVASTNVENGHSERYDYGANHMVEEHIFIADDNKAGWILGTCLDLTTEKMSLSCFAADSLASGPIAIAELPYALPLGFHGNFIKAS